MRSGRVILGLAVVAVGLVLGATSPVDLGVPATVTGGAVVGVGVLVLLASRGGVAVGDAGSTPSADEGSRARPRWDVEETDGTERREAEAVGREEPTEAETAADEADEADETRGGEEQHESEHDEDETGIVDDRSDDPREGGVVDEAAGVDDEGNNHPESQVVTGGFDWVREARTTARTAEDSQTVDARTAEHETVEDKSSDDTTEGETAEGSETADEVPAEEIPADGDSQEQESGTTGPVRTDTESDRQHQIATARTLASRIDRACRDGDSDAAEETLEELEGLLDTLPADADPAPIETLERRTTELRTELARLRGRDRLERLVDEASSMRDDATAALDRGESRHAVDTAESGLESVREAERVADEHDIVPGTDLAETRERLASLAETARTRLDCLADAEGSLGRAERARYTKEYETAQAAVADARASLAELPAPARDDAVATDDAIATDDEAADLHERADELAGRVERERAERRLDELLESIDTAHESVERALRDGEYDSATEQLNAAVESCDESTTLVDQYGLEDGGQVETRRRRTQRLRDEAETRPTDDLAETVAAAEETVAEGIRCREADEYGAALDAFESGLERYAAAESLAAEQDLPSLWEVRERRAMVREYVEVTGAEFDRRSRRVTNELTNALEEAAERLDRAEQHWEVDDTVAARENLEAAVRRLDEATDFVRTDAAPAELHERYDGLARRAESLYETVPRDDSREFRNRDLIESLQLLATTLGESPRPEFVNAYGTHPADAYLATFGSWRDALAAANLDPVDEDARNRRAYTRTEVLDALVDLAEELGRPPTRAEMNERGAISASPVVDRFGSWEAALDIGGVEDVDGSRGDDPDEPESQTTPTEPPEGGRPATGEDATPVPGGADTAPEGAPTAGDEVSSESADLVEALMRDMEF